MRNCVQQASKQARAGDIRKAQVIAKGWNRKMREQVSSEAQIQNYQAFNANFGNVYSQLNSIKEEERQEELQMQQMFSAQPQQQVQL